MKMRDHKNKEKISKYDLNPNLHEGVSDEGMQSLYLDQKDGIVRIVRNTHESEEEFHTMQEQHNANHALNYFNMISESAIRGRSTGNDCEKIRRTREHIMNLREFIGEDKAGLKDVLNILLRELEKFCPIKKKQFAFFIYKNWDLILSFAEAYGHHDRCFPKDKYEKLQDVVLLISADRV